MSNRIYFRGTRQDAKRLIHALTQSLVGQDSSMPGIARGVFSAMGMAALSDIKSDYVRKARGGTGEDGVKWPPLEKETIAYSRRFGSGEKAKLKKAAGLGRGHRFGAGGKTGLLSASQKKQWNAIYASTLKRMLASTDLASAKVRAAQVAWATMKKRGAKTKLEVYGNRSVEILRDTGILLNSLSPGEMTGSEYQSSTEDQVFDTITNGVIVGTNVPYAATHQYGDAKRGIPARPFLPEGDAPQVWQGRWAAVARLAIVVGLRRALGAA